MNNEVLPSDIEALAEILWHDEFLNKHFPAHLIEESMKLNKEVFPSYLSLNNSFKSLIKIFISLPKSEISKLKSLLRTTIETESLLKKSFFLTTTGSYNLGLSGLRNAIECQVRGIFCTIIFKNLLNDSELFPGIARSDYKSLNTIISENSNVIGKPSDSLEFSNLIENFEAGRNIVWPAKVNTGNLKGPKGLGLKNKIHFCGNNSILEPVSDGSSKSMEDFFSLINFQKMNEYVHESFFASDTVKEIEHIESNPDDVFTLNRVRGDFLGKYLVTLNRVVDFMLVMSLNSIDNYGTEVKKVIKKEKSSFKIEFVPNAYSILVRLS